MNLLASIPPEILRCVREVSFEVSSPHCQKDIEALLRRTVLLEGKRLRPLLTYLMGNLFGLGHKRVKLYADSIELVHAASLAHDDVIDNATTRRGTPSINVLGDNKRAVLAGDYLLAHVMANLARHGRWELVEEMGLVVSSLARGEWLQMDVSLARRTDWETLEEVARLKTASVMSWCAVAPAILCGLPDALVTYCRQFGEHLGIAFQQIDDALDWSERGGKDRLLDWKNGTVNSVLLEWMLSDETLLECFAKGEDLAIQEMPREVVLRVRQRANARLDSCRKLLQVILAEMPAEFALSKESQEAALRPLHLILDYLAQRTA